MRSRFVAALVAVVLTSSEASAENTWARKWNHARTYRDYEAAAEDIEKHSYLSLSGYAISPVVPIADSLRATDLEVEFAWFFVSKIRLEMFQQNRTAENLEEFQLRVRRLSRVPGLHEMSLLMIARARELADPAYGYDINLDVRVPVGSANWTFTVDHYGGDIVNDFRKEYEATFNARKPSILSLFCVLTVFGCFLSIRFDDESVILDLLRFPIRLQVSDKENNIISIPTPPLLHKQPTR